MDSASPKPLGHDLKGTFLGLGIAFPLLSITCVILRFEARRINRNKIEADDWMSIAALVRGILMTYVMNTWLIRKKIFTIGATVNILIDSQLGNLGGHEDPTNPDFIKQTIIFQKVLICVF